MAEKFVNDAQTTINQAGGISSSDLSFTVTSAALFPATGEFRIRVDDELMMVTGVAGNVFTVTRAIESTAAVGHSDGAYVTAVLTADALLLLAGGGAMTDENVKVSAADTTAGPLNSKVAAGTNVSTTILNPGANEQLEISSVDENVKVTVADTTPSVLNSKVAAGANIVLTVLNPGANEQLEIASSGGGVTSTFVFQPGGVAADNVYTDWSLLMTDLATISGPKVIEFDTTLSGVGYGTIPSGTWTIGRETTLRGSSVDSKIVMADGAVFQNAWKLDGRLQLWSASTAPVFSWSGAPNELLLSDFVEIYGSQKSGGPAAPTSPLITTGGTTILLRDAAALRSSVGPPDQPILSDTTGSSLVGLWDYAAVKQDSGTGDSYALNCSGAGSIAVWLIDQGAYYQHVAVSGLTWSPYAVRREVIDLTKGIVSNATITPASCGAGYVSFKNVIKHSNVTCKFRAIIETTSGSVGYEAYVDLFDVFGQINTGSPGIPQPVPGSQIDTGTGSPPSGAPTPNSLLPSLYEVDLTAAILGATWVSDIAILEARVWIGTAGGGNAATCKQAELIFEWTEN